MKTIGIITACLLLTGCVTYGPYPEYKSPVRSGYIMSPQGFYSINETTSQGGTTGTIIGPSGTTIYGY